MLVTQAFTLAKPIYAALAAAMYMAAETVTRVPAAAPLPAPGASSSPPEEKKKGFLGLV